MATTKVRTDTKGRQITQTAYDAQKRAGTDVSKYTKIGTPVVPTTKTQAPTISYKNDKGKTLSQKGYDIQKKAGIDVSKYTKTGTSAAPAVQAVVSPTPGITDGITTPVSTTPGITDAMKNTQTYKNLLSKGYSEQQISDAFTSKTKLSGEPAGTPTPVTTETTTPATNLGKDPMAEAVTPAQDVPDAGQRDYKDDSSQRLEQIVTHLDSYSQTNPNLFTDKAKYKEFFHYNERSQAQKDVLDNYFSKHNTPSLDIFGGLTESQIGDGYLNGTFTDNDLLNLKNSDPNKRQLAQTYINNQNTYNAANDSITGALKSVKQILGMPTAPEDADFVGKYDEYLNTPEIKALSEGLAAKKGEIETIDQKIADMRKTIEDQYAGTGMNQDIVDAIAADKMEALTRDKTRKEIAYNTELNKYNGLVNIGEGKYQAYKNDIEQKRQERQDNLSQLDFYYGSTPQGMLEIAQLTGGGQQEILTKDFGTSKAPNWKQSLDGGKTRQDIEGISGGGYSGGGYSGGGYSSGGYSGGGYSGGGYSGGIGSGGKYLEEIKSLLYRGRNSRMASGLTQFVPGGGLGAEIATKVDNFKFLKENLTLDKFVDLKGKGATFGAMSDAEWEIIRNAATKLNRNISDAAWNAELTKIYNAANRLGRIVENADKSITIDGKTYKTPEDVRKGIYTTSSSGGGTNNNTNTTNNNSGSYGLNFGDIFNM